MGCFIDGFWWNKEREGEPKKNGEFVRVKLGEPAESKSEEREREREWKSFEKVGTRLSERSKMWFK